MQREYGLIKEKAGKLLAEGTVDRVYGWKSGEFFYDPTPALFKSGEELEGLVYDSFCSANLSKYLIEESRKEGKLLALLKPCDTYGFNQLLKEHRINREGIYVLGIGCDGMLDINKIKELGFKGIVRVEEAGEQVVVHTIYGEGKCERSSVLLEKCLSCKGKAHKVYDELVIENSEEMDPIDRFAAVREVEALSPEERFEFWQGELSRCIRCNACRNICPVCSCLKCVFDNDQSGVASKANTDAFEEKLFHIIRAFHVAGRCTDCGECSRVCPQNIPLHLLNRKIIKDINQLYGDYQAGEDPETPGPLTSFNKEDAEPGSAALEGGKR